MQVFVKKWGNSASIRIPSSIMSAAGLKVDQAVDVREEAGRLIIEPVTSIEYNLDELLAGITAENVHAEVDFGLSVGKELL
ncbi:AbrB/MazE/SpoVT family DNA-binding domain-containing protein [Acetobacter orientalis]|uniref:AbrB/MazE/SpoVT family DNA-binding domain-containing protein n=1 Tax=Acetobacter orientalis TaxID=146474 RepID=UPI0020A0B1AB|nr:AbrB/MazE/SpoVT family DNA-binding domain-containing protein [Acetobacter orientalis]MCP1217162.1 AbrB/MazE/SpoVT family DNA-binding domain-containing protein [Acetobacter orientalis]MCP1220089.1 AbrB/MazE/SpoVT family DNA-binding domain-containing protein [Acetobacter orientalis]